MILLIKERMEDWLQPNGTVIQTHIPNEIFEDLSNADLKSWKHRAFSYTYYYLINYTYRNTLYNKNPMDYSQDNIIKSIIQKSNTISYITKKNGVLDQIGYTETTNNYPLTYYMDGNILEFSTIKEIEGLVKNEVGNRYFIKRPKKSFKRFNNEDCTGTYYDMQNTHYISIQRFIEMLSDVDLGYVAIYIYGYLSMMSDRFPKGFKVSNKELATVIGCTERTISKYTKLLEDRGFIKSEREVYGFKLLEKKYTVIDKHDLRKKKKAKIK